MKTTLLRIVVASPNDVQAERAVLEMVVDELNRGVAADRHLHLVLVKWETDTYPGFHAAGPQGLIDPILNIADCDILIGIFWKRFGTPTKGAQSGTEYEIRKAHEAWQEQGHPQIMVYFNQKPYTPQSFEETEQWGRVLKFKEDFPQEGLYWEYDEGEFEDLARNHLTQYIRRQYALPFQSPEPISADAEQQRRIDAAVPSQAAVDQWIDLLVQARFPDSPLLGAEDFPSKQKPASIEQITDEVSLTFPKNPETGALEDALLNVHVIAPDFTIEGTANQMIEVPPDKESKTVYFLLAARKTGTCRINVQVSNVEGIYLGTIPLETTVGDEAPAPQPLVANLLLSVAVGEETAPPVTPPLSEPEDTFFGTRTTTVPPPQAGETKGDDFRGRSACLFGALLLCSPFLVLVGLLIWLFF